MKPFFLDMKPEANDETEATTVRPWVLVVGGLGLLVLLCFLLPLLVKCWRCVVGRRQRTRGYGEFSNPLVPDDGD